VDRSKRSKRATLAKHTHTQAEHGRKEKKHKESPLTVILGGRDKADRGCCGLFFIIITAVVCRGEVHQIFIQVAVDTGLRKRLGVSAQTMDQNGGERHGEPGL